MKNKKLICIIPLRSKSKGIINKNIKMMAGVPLSVYSIKAACNCLIFKKVVIAIDDFSYKKKFKIILLTTK